MSHLFFEQQPLALELLLQHLFLFCVPSLLVTGNSVIENWGKDVDFVVEKPKFVPKVWVLLLWLCHVDGISNVFWQGPVLLGLPVTLRHIIFNAGSTGVWRAYISRLILLDLLSCHQNQVDVKTATMVPYSAASNLPSHSPLHHSRFPEDWSRWTWLRIFKFLSFNRVISFCALSEDSVENVVFAEGDHTLLHRASFFQFFDLI